MTRTRRTKKHQISLLDGNYELGSNEEQLRLLKVAQWMTNKEMMVRNQHCCCPTQRSNDGVDSEEKQSEIRRAGALTRTPPGAVYSEKPHNNFSSLGSRVGNTL